MKFYYGICVHCGSQMIVVAEKKKVICPNCGEICRSEESIKLHSTGRIKQPVCKLKRKTTITIMVSLAVIVLVFGISCLVAAFIG